MYNHFGLQLHLLMCLNGIIRTPKPQRARAKPQLMCMKLLAGMTMPAPSNMLPVSLDLRIDLGLGKAKYSGRLDVWLQQEKQANSVLQHL